MSDHSLRVFLNRKFSHLHMRACSQLCRATEAPSGHTSHATPQAVVEFATPQLRRSWISQLRMRPEISFQVIEIRPMAHGEDTTCLLFSLREHAEGAVGTYQRVH